MRKTRKTRVGKKGKENTSSTIQSESNETKEVADPQMQSEENSVDQASPATKVQPRKRSRIGKKKSTENIPDKSPIRRSVKRVTNQRLDIVERLKSQEHLLANAEPENSDNDILGRLRISDDEHEKEKHETKSSSEPQTLSEDDDSIHGVFNVQEADSQEEGELLDKCRQNGVMLSSDEELPEKEEPVPERAPSNNSSFVENIQEEKSGIIREVPNAVVLDEGVLCPPGSLCWSSQDPDSLLASSCSSATPTVIERNGSLTIYITKDGRRKHKHRRHKKHTKSKVLSGNIM